MRSQRKWRTTRQSNEAKSKTSRRRRRLASGQLINVTDLSKHFTSPDGSQIVAVDRVSFEVRRGEAYGLLGPNGAGKTTTLRMILGLLQPSSGDSTIDGASVAREPDRVKRLIGFVSTSVGVYQWLSPREMLSFVADLYDVEPDTAAQRIDSLSDLLDFRPYVDRRCGVLSTGQKQRVNLARALMHDPPVMLLDEPTSGLDIVGSQVVFEFIQHLRSEGKAVIICTHRLGEAERFANRFGLLHEGRLRHVGTLDELRKETSQPSLTDMFIQLLGKSSSELLS